MLLSKREASNRINYNEQELIKKKEEQKTLVSKTCRYSKSSLCIYVPENIIFFSFHLAVVPLHSFHVVSLSSYIRVYPKRERTGGYSRGSMDEDLAAIFKQTRRHCLVSLFSIQHAMKKHLAHGFEKLHNYDNQRPHENRGNKKSVTRFSRRFARTRPASNAVETFSRTDAFIYSCVYFVCLSMITRVAA